MSIASLTTMSFGAVLENLASYTELDLRDRGLSAEDCQQLARRLKNNETVKILDLSGPFPSLCSCPSALSTAKECGHVCVTPRPL